MTPTKEELAIDYWTQPDVENAKRVIAAHLGWGYRAVDDIPLFLTLEVRKALGDLKSKIALEIGCGVGRILLPMAMQFGDVVGIDICPRMVELSREYLHPFRERERIYVELCDGKRIPLDDGLIDFVYSMICFQHLPDLATVRSYLREAYRVMKPGGVIRIQTQLGPEPPQWDVHWGRFFPSLHAFADEFTEAGFEIFETNADVLFALPARREPIESLWIWVSARKPTCP